MYMRLKNKRIVYALYRGDEFLDCGTAEELAKRRGISKLSFDHGMTTKLYYSLKNAMNEVR